MDTVVLQGDSKDDLDLLVALAKKLGINVRVLDEQMVEEEALIYAIKKGKTGETVDVQGFIDELKK
jgi:molybdenum cofactor biosynthesis enzyme MoaA